MITNLIRGKTNTAAQRFSTLGQPLAGSTRSRGKSPSRLLYVIPVLALVAIMIVFAVAVTPQPSAPAVMNFTYTLVIQITNNNSSSVRNIAPAHPIGEAGGTWAVHNYDTNGVDAAHYPLYMDNPAIACAGQGAACTIHVKSKVQHDYTLGDFFAVWGYTIGPTNTLNIKPSGSFAWQMCLGAQRPAQRSDAWGSLVLQPNQYVTLLYFDTVNGFGCSPS